LLKSDRCQILSLASSVACDVARVQDAVSMAAERDESRTLITWYSITQMAYVYLPNISVINYRHTCSGLAVLYCCVVADYGLSIVAYGLQRVYILPRCAAIYILCARHFMW